MILVVGMTSANVTSAAEWSTEPSVKIDSAHNDNVGMRSADERSSSSYTLAPGVKFEGREVNWDVAMSALVKATRYSQADNSDSDNYFFNLGGGYSIERQTFRLDSSFIRNTTYDTDYETALPDAGLTADITERETTTFKPSWQWQTSESSMLSVSASTNDIQYDEVSSTIYRSYQLDSLIVKNMWNLTARSRLGFTLSYEQYENEKNVITLLDVDFIEYQEYKQYVFQLDYLFSMTETSKLNLSVGSRKMDSVSHSEPVGCLVGFGDVCLLPELEDVARSNNGAVVTFEYSHSNEVSSFSTALSRIVVPSSYGGAQEQDLLTIQYDTSLSERWRAGLLLEGRETTSIEGLDSRSDRTIYRFEPRLSWRLKRDWSLSLSYRHLKQNLAETDVDSESNIILVSLNMKWPRLASTY